MATGRAGVRAPVNRLRRAGDRDSSRCERTASPLAARAARPSSRSRDDDSPEVKNTNCEFPVRAYSWHRLGTDST